MLTIKEKELRGRGETEECGPLLLDLFWFLLFPQCEQSALEGMKACVTYFPRACGSLKVSTYETVLGLPLDFIPAILVFTVKTLT